MKREFLEGLELDRETVDTIMAEYGKTTQGLREAKDTLKTQLDNVTNEFKNYKEETSNYSQQIETLTNENGNLKNQLSDYEYTDELRKSNVDEKYNDFLKHEAKKGMNENTDFKTSLNKFLEKNPQYKKQENVRRVNSSFSMSGSNVTQSSNATMNNSILAALGKNR